MKTTLRLAFGLLALLTFVLLGACAKPPATELLLNGEFDEEQSIGPKDSPTAYDQWVDWHVVFENHSVGFASVFVNNDPGYGEGDNNCAISWANGNYNLILSQQVSAPKGSFEASIALLLGSGNFTMVTLKVLGPDGKTVLAQIDKPQDRTNLAEETSNNLAQKDWQILTVPVEFAQTQDVTYTVEIHLGPGGVNPFIRMDNASIKGYPKS